MRFYTNQFVPYNCTIEGVSDMNPDMNLSVTVPIEDLHKALDVLNTADDAWWNTDVGYCVPHPEYLSDCLAEANIPHVLMMDEEED